MMRLTDLDPRWIMLDSRRVGFTFITPKQRERSDGTVNPRAERQSCFAEPTKMSVQLDLFDQMHGEDAIVQPCRQDFAWAIVGGIENADFPTMSVTPSLDGSAGGLWHGHITNGEIVGGIG